MMKMNLSYLRVLSSNTIQNLDEKLNELDAVRPIQKTILSKIQEQLQIEMTYNSNAIEGNTLTLKETFLVMQEGLTIKGKSLKDHLEVTDQTRALEFLYKIVSRRSKIKFSEVVIRQFHSLVVQSTESDISGKYREGIVQISGSSHRPPEANEVADLMNKLVLWLKKEGKKLHVVERAAIIHHKLVSIHPFWDGNGRTARLIMNLILMQAGFPIAVILKVDRKRYYRVLSQADKGDLKPICEFVAQAVNRSLNLYLKSIKVRPKVKQGKSLKELSKKSDYSSNYLRKLATQGKLEAWKEGRNWLSTEEALEKYAESIKSKL